MISSATAQEIRFRISNGEKIRTIAQSLGREFPAIFYSRSQEVR